VTAPNYKTASRLDAIKPSITLAVTAKAARLKAQGIDVVSFGAGEPDFDTPAHIKAAAVDALGKGAVAKYTDVAGLLVLREAIAAELSRVHATSIAADQVLVSCGAKHSLYNLFLALLDPGDEVIIPAPYWVSYPDMVMMAGGTPVILPTSPDDDFTVRPDALRARITPRTRAIVLNNPSNPTGAVYTPAQVKALAEVVVEKNLLVISDDIYRSLCYGDAVYQSIAALGPELAARTILVDGVSKTYAMTGWRIGYTAGPTSIIKAMAKVQASRPRTRRTWRSSRPWPRSPGPRTASRPCARPSTSAGWRWSSCCAPSPASPAASPRARSTPSRISARSSAPSSPTASR
jgi:aspartate aminotransferase